MGNQLCDCLLITYCGRSLKNTKQVHFRSNWNLEMWVGGFVDPGKRE